MTIPRNNVHLIRINHYQTIFSTLFKNPLEDGKRQPYIRTLPQTLDKMREAVELAPALTVHNQQLNNTSMCDGPRDLRQVRSLKYREKKKQKPQVAEGESALTNFADHVQNTCNITCICIRLYKQCYNSKERRRL